MAARRLYRSNRERILGGVAGGMAEYFDVDPTLIRLLWVVAVIAGGFGLLAYVIAWIIMPESPTGSGRRERSDPPGEGSPAHDGDLAGDGDGDRQERGGVTAHLHETGDEEYRSSESGYWLLGLILVGLGVFLLLRNFVPWLRLGEFWPVLIILLGVLLLAGAFRNRPERGE